MKKKRIITPNTTERGLVRIKDIKKEKRIKNIKKTISGLLILVLPVILVFFACMIQRTYAEDALNFMIDSPGIVFINVALIYMVFFAIMAISRMPALSFFLTSILYLSLPVISRLKYDVRGEVFVISEFGLIKNIGQILSFVEVSDVLRGVLIKTGIFIAVATLIISLLKSKRHRLSSLVSFLLSIAFLIVVFSNNETLKSFGINENIRYAPNIVHDMQGTILGVYSNFIMNKIEEPQGYCKEKVYEILDKVYKEKNSGEILDSFGDVINKKSSGNTVKPDVVMIMSESFFDPKTLKNVEFSQDPIPNIRKLMEKNISGTFISSTFGGGTSNIEYEAFTGTSSEFMPYGTVPYTDISLDNLKNLQTLPKIYKKNGYKTVALHTYIGSFYNRTKVYPTLGFDAFKEANDLNEVGYYGKYVGDVTMYKNIIAELEKDEGIPKFIWALTMQNHTPYSAKVLGEEAIYVTASGENLSEDSKDVLEGYVNGIYESDRRLTDIINYLEETKRPTILLFFGDHKPGFYEVYKDLNMISSKDTTKWTVDEMLKMHEGTFLVYQNFDNEIKLENTDIMGAIGLGNMLLNLSNVEKTSFFNFLDMVNYKALRDRLFVDEKNVAHKEITSECLEKINEHKVLQYDMLYGKNYIERYDKEKFEF